MAPWTSSSPPVMALAVALMLCGLPAGALPVSPDVDRCVNGDHTLKCCPTPSGKQIIDFTQPPPPTTLRVRRPAHSLNPKAAANYAKAIAAMRELPPDHPWNFLQQSNVHCAYCSGGHRQAGTNISLEIHGSWLFFPWHRAYLYFYERILGKLAGDPSFALPFWNWDHPDGMSVPAIYRDPSSPLYNPTRYPQTLNFTNIGCEGDVGKGLEKQKQCNLRLMHRQFAAASDTAELFLGGQYRKGDTDAPGGGVLEGVPHNPIHVSTGSDMSLLRTSGRDPLFIAHHANMDRLWSIWQSTSGGGRTKSFHDPDFLNASFVFWDENMQRVRIRVRDCIDARMQLNYYYEDVPNLWLNMKTEVEQVVADNRMRPRSIEPEVNFPAVLGSSITVEVRRTPGVEGQKLIVGGIEFDRGAKVWFDVYVGSARGDGRRVTARAAAGCFVHMWSSAGASEGSTMSTELRLGIREFVEAIGAAGDDTVVVTLVPKIGGDMVTIGRVWIE
ncbi:Polyphenol oxidase, chloroplastic [Apostasia shenzhenica]|uniref:Polyphenol oxidase, chloroplastic n=1 Tax=Apostasia shenzhenica TaxID=1088818 RepID=A0A2I0A3U6_9ASPA|nr:Polyphenol oxidase, chloroplastic [Apostasia shenzhenica]